MIEMVVHTVDVHPKTGKPVVVLTPKAKGAGPMLALSITRAEACSLSHELSLKPTLRGQAFALLDRSLSCLGARVTEIRLIQAAPGLAAASVNVARPGDHFELDVEVGHAIGLAVALKMPLLAAEGLGQSLAADERSRPAEDAKDAVPAAFRRAFDD